MKLNNEVLLKSFHNAFLELGYIGDLANLQELSIDNNYLCNLEVLQSCSNLIKLDISYNQFLSLDGLDQCKELQSLDIRGTQIGDISILEEFTDFNSIYVDDDFERDQLNFLIGNFRNGDTKTKQYLLEKQYNL